MANDARQLLVPSGSRLAPTWDGHLAAPAPGNGVYTALQHGSAQQEDRYRDQLAFLQRGNSLRSVGVGGAGSPTTGSDAGSGAGAETPRKGNERIRIKLRNLEESTGFQLLTTSVILLNVFTFYCQADELLFDLEGWVKVNIGFQTFFVCELVMRLCAHGPSFFCTKRCHRGSMTTCEALFWNLFDFFIVFCSLLETILDDLKSDDDKQGLGAIMMIFRMFRMLRVVRAIRVLKKCPELYILLQGLVSSLVVVGWVAVMFFIILVGCAVFVTQTVGQQAEDFSDPALIRHDFGTVRASMRTLFIFLTFDDWSTTARVVNETYPWMELFWFCYLFIGSFTLLSVLTGIMADAMASAMDDHDVIVQKDQADQMKTLDKHIQKLFHKSGRDNHLQVDLPEFVMMLRVPQTKAILKECNIELTAEEAEYLYVALFGTQGPVLFTEFCKGMETLSKASRQARVKDIMLLEGQVYKLDRNLLQSRRLEQVDVLHVRASMLWERTRTLQARLEAVFELAGYDSFAM